MSKASRMQAPGNGANDLNDKQNSPFQIHWPDPGIEDTEDTEDDTESVLTPERIVHEFKQHDEPFAFYKFMLDHLTDLVHDNFFESYTKEGLEEFISRYYNIANTIFNLEKHVADRDLECNIYSFMELVLRKGESELREAMETVKAIKGKYRSLTNGLHHFEKDYRQNLSKVQK